MESKQARRIFEHGVEHHQRRTEQLPPILAHAVPPHGPLALAKRNDDLANQPSPRSRKDPKVFFAKAQGLPLAPKYFRESHHPAGDSRFDLRARASREPHFQ